MKKINVDASHSKISGNFVISDTIQDSFKNIESTDASDDIKTTLLQLGKAVEAMANNLPREIAEEVVEDYKKLADESLKKTPKHKWYSVSIDGLQKAAKNLGEIGKPVLELTAQLLVLLSQLSK